MTSEKPDWFQISEGDAITPEARAKSKKLPIVAAAAVGAIILGGALFANANDESNADASTNNVPAITTPGTPTPAVSGAPSIAPVAPNSTAGGEDGFHRDGEHRDGEHRDGEHRDGFRPDGDHHRI